MSLHNPVVYAYLLAVAVYLAFGVIVLAVALILSVWRRGRRTARRLAGGIIGSLPAVFFFQGLSLPVLAILAAVPSLVEMSGPVTFTVVSGLILAVFGAASITGILAGWGVGARIASGVAVRDALGGSRALRLLAMSLSKLPLTPRTITPERAIAFGLGAIVLTVGGLALGRIAYVEAYGSDEIDYRGEKIRLAKKYVDYDDYKNDPENLASSEIPRVEMMMTEARIGPAFTNRKDFIDQAFAIKFPGYGMGPAPKVVADAREFIVEVIEIPQVSKDRYLVAEKLADGTLQLVDDFVIRHGPASAYSVIRSIRLVDDRLVYLNRESGIARETPIAR